jgi:hypothetical protein
VGRHAQTYVKPVADLRGNARLHRGGRAVTVRQPQASGGFRSGSSSPICDAILR